MVSSSGSPPLAATRMRPLVAFVANTIVPSEPQLAPRAPPLVSQMMDGGPPKMETLCNARPAKKPTHSPSGDTKGLRNDGSSLSMEASSSLTSRTTSRRPSATYTTRAPSGVIVKSASRRVRRGGSDGVLRIDRTSGRAGAGCRLHTATPVMTLPSNNAATSAGHPARAGATSLG